jgi:hypothetical protein
MPDPIWGVDSAAPVTEQLLRCVKNAYGTPKVWGRYIKTVPGAADGLTRSEIDLIHRNGIKIMPIYSDFREAVGTRSGQTTARNAIYNSQRLGIPRGVVVFANIERWFNVDDAWIRAWVDTFYTSDYKPGIYHWPLQGGFSSAYCKAEAASERVRTQTVLWSGEPAPGVTPEQEAPEFKPASPPCRGNVWAWQYGRDSTVCPVDTNLISPQLLPLLW